MKNVLVNWEVTDLVSVNNHTLTKITDTLTGESNTEWHRTQCRNCDSWQTESACAHCLLAH